MDTSAYFNMLTRLMGSDIAPPAAEDAPIIARLARIGIVPGQSSTSPNSLAGRPGGAQGCRQGGLQPRSSAAQSTSGTLQNGWHIQAAVGAYGTDYLGRALVAAFGWPANLPDNAVYPYAAIDGADKSSMAPTGTP